MPRAVLVADDFDPIPSVARTAGVELAVTSAVPAHTTAVAVSLAEESDAPESLGLSREALASAGFTGGLGQTLLDFTRPGS